MKIQVPLVVELDDDQLFAYAEKHGLPSPLRAKDVVRCVRQEVLAEVKYSESFGRQLACDNTSFGATVTIKGGA